MKPLASETFKLSKIALFTMLFIVAPSAQVFAQSSRDFSNLQKHINKQVTVDTQDGQSTGQLLRAEESRLVVYEGGKPQPIARELVKRVALHKSSHTVEWIEGTSAAWLGSRVLGGFRAF